MKNYVCRVLIQFNDSLNKDKEYKKNSIYKCSRERYEQIKKLGAVKLLKIERRKR